MRRFMRLLLAASAFLPVAGAHGDTPATAWDKDDIRALAEVIESARAEGLDPADYAGQELDAMSDPGVPDQSTRADEIALSLAHDFFEGHVPLSARADWHFSRESVDYGSWLEAVKTSHSVRGSFQQLLPQGRDYAALRAALVSCRAAARDCAALETNLDRWRALPRQFGRSYLWVNVPAFRLDLVVDGRIVASHKVIVGKPGTRTPLFRATVTGVIANPWWNVPCSIVDESIGKLIRTNPKEAAARGYVATTDAQGKLVVRQKPGPANALGKLKLEMPNPYGVYIHDTPTRDLFVRDARALSHGCIRTDQPDELARTLLGADRAREFDLALTVGATRTIKLPQTVPVYVVYLTMEAASGAPGGVAKYPDIYHRD